MQEQLKVAIKRWQDADRKVRENTKLLLRGDAEGRMTAEERIKVLFQAESMLGEAISVADPAELPTPIAVWLATSQRHGRDPACSECWFSTAWNEQKHPKCVEKIKQYFDAVEAMRAL